VVGIRTIAALALLLCAQPACAESSILAGIEAHVGLVLLIASLVIIVLMILMVFYLHNISEHLNWIRRIR
jgi:hypothetical protein